MHFACTGEIYQVGNRLVEVITNHKSWMTSDTPIGGKQFPWVTHLLTTLKHFFETVSLQSLLFLRILSQDFSLNLFKSYLICVASSSILSGELWFWSFSCWLELGFLAPFGWWSCFRSRSTVRPVPWSTSSLQVPPGPSSRPVEVWYLVRRVLWLPRGGNKILEMLLKLKDSQRESRL